MIDLSSRIALLKESIATEESAIRAQKLLAVGVFCAGLVVAVLIHILSGGALGERSKWVLSICSPLISTGGTGFPLKEVYQRRYRINRLRFLAAEYENCHKNSVDASAVPYYELKDFMTFVEETCGG
jgi:hypothetical protein